MPDRADRGRAGAGCLRVRRLDGGTIHDVVRGARRRNSRTGPGHRPGALASFSGAAAGPVGSDRGHVVWESGPLEADSSQPILHDRTLSTGTTRTIARKVDPLYGVASTARWVFFARTTGSGTQLLEGVARGHPEQRGDGLAGLAGRLPWRRGRVGGGVWLVASGSWLSTPPMTCSGRSPACRAARSPAATRSAPSRSQTTASSSPATRSALRPSLVVRREFGATGTQSVAIADDPQPDLVPSSSGALYYALSRGWYRWDFGDSRPSAVALADDPVKSLIRHEGGRWYWLSRQGCDYRVESGAGRRWPRHIRRARAGSCVPRQALACTHLGGFAWTGRQAIMSWVIASAAAVERPRGCRVAGGRRCRPPSAAVGDRAAIAPPAAGPFAAVAWVVRAARQPAPAYGPSRIRPELRLPAIRPCLGENGNNLLLALRRQKSARPRPRLIARGLAVESARLWSRRSAMPSTVVRDAARLTAFLESLPAEIDPGPCWSRLGSRRAPCLGRRSGQG